MTIIFGSDHAGFPLRRILASRAIDLGYAVSEVGAQDEQPYDYPDAAGELASRIQKGDADLGVLICGTGIGMSIAANRFKGVRAAVAWNERVARLAREHNFANILCLGARLIDSDQAIEIFDAFLHEPVSGETRHARRVAKMDAIVDAQTPTAIASQA
ncbi:MAG: RpiB/LacA/LacB family sugar-phosphate isomerase [Armatimonadota bacterium]|nr:RpiB/LacA/LacB family sugar-phosphate isomerase [Armatimonadota bacterium]